MNTASSHIWDLKKPKLTEAERTGVARGGRKEARREVKGRR